MPGTNKEYGREQVLEIVNSVVHKVEESETVSKEALYEELRSLQDIINDARQQLSLTGADSIGDKHIPIATDELDAVVEATAMATGTIMDACEVIEKKADGDNGNDVKAQVTKIYEACFSRH